MWIYVSFLTFVSLPAANIVIQPDPAIKTSSPGNHVPRFNTEPYNRKRTVIPSSADGPAVKKPWMEK